MTSLPEIAFTLDQLHPGAGRFGLNTCNSPDCMSIGQGFEPNEDRKARFALSHAGLSPEQASAAELHGPSAYKLAGAYKRYKCVSRFG